jgi:hypothetical protein
MKQAIQYQSCEGTKCEYKNCKMEVEYIQVKEDTERGWYEGKLRCEKHKTL